MSAAAAALCLTLGAKIISLDTTRFTLQWTHSVAKTLWEEDYELQDGKLILIEARIGGTGAGMEPPPGAQFRAGIWHYRPDLPPLPELRLTLSPYTADYRLCWATTCRSLGDLLAAAHEPAIVVVHSCPAT